MMLNVHVHVSVKIWSVTNPAVNGNFSKSRLAINGVSPEMQIFTIITNYTIVLHINIVLLSRLRRMSRRRDIATIDSVVVVGVVHILVNPNVKVL